MCGPTCACRIRRSPGLHVLLRYLDGRWVAIDNDSRNGMFLGEQRVYSVDIRSGQTIHLGDPEGPWLTFELGPAPRPDDQPTTQIKHGGRPPGPKC